MDEDDDDDEEEGGRVRHERRKYLGFMLSGSRAKLLKISLNIDWFVRYNRNGASTSSVNARKR